MKRISTRLRMPLAITVATLASATLAQERPFEISDFGLVYGQKQSGDARESRTVGLDYQFKATIPGSPGNLQGQAWVQATDWEAAAGTNQHAPEARDAWGLKLVYPLDHHQIEFSHYRLGEGVDPAGDYGAKGGTEDTRLAWRTKSQFNGNTLKRLDREIQFQHTQSLTSGDERGGLTLRLKGDGLAGKHRLEAWVRHEEQHLHSDQKLMGDLSVASGQYHHTRYGVAFIPAAGGNWDLGLHAESGGYLAGEHAAVGAQMNWRPLERMKLKAEYRLNEYSGDFVGALDDHLIAHSMSLSSSLLVNPWWSFTPGVKYDSIDNKMGLKASLKWSPSAVQDFLLDWKRSILMGLGAGSASGQRDSVIMGTYRIRM